MNCRVKLILVAATLTACGNTDNQKSVVSGNDKFQATEIANGLKSPWGMTFAGEDKLLVTEKRRGLALVDLATNKISDVTGGPSFIAYGQGGLLDIKKHPDFQENGLIYITYAKSVAGGQTTALWRGQLRGTDLRKGRDLFVAKAVRDSGRHFGSRIAIDSGNKLLYLTVGDRGYDDVFVDIEVGDPITSNPPPVIQAFSNFGHSIALDATGSKLIVGAPELDKNGYIDTGEVYLFTLEGSRGVTGYTLKQTFQEDTSSAKSYYGFNKVVLVNNLL